jgi:hypothetical protein
VAVQMTMVGSAITADLVTTAASVDPATTAGLVTTAASVGPAMAGATMVEATMVEAAATTKPRPALLCVMPRAKLGSPDRGLISKS